MSLLLTRKNSLKSYREVSVDEQLIFINLIEMDTEIRDEI